MGSKARPRIRFELSVGNRDDRRGGAPASGAGEVGHPLFHSLLSKLSLTRPCAARKSLGNAGGRARDKQRRKTRGQEERLTCGPTHKGRMDYSQ